MVMFPSGQCRGKSIQNREMPVRSSESREAGHLLLGLHYCAVGVGHISDRLTKLGALLSMDVVRVWLTR